MTLLIAALFLVEFVRGAALISFLPIYGKNELGLELDVIGIATTAHFVTDAVVKLFIGYLMHRFNVRTLVSGGLLLSLAGMLMLGQAELPWVFIVGCAIYGIGISPIWIVCLTRVTEERRATQMGTLYTFWLVGLGVGPVVTNFTLEYSSAITYWILVLASAIALLLSLFIPKRSHAEIDFVPFKRQLALLGDRLKEMKLLLPGMVLQTLGAGMLMPILPSFASDHLGLAPSQYSLLLFIGGGCTAAALIPMGRLADSVGRKWFLVLGFLLFAIALFALTRGPGLGISLMWACVLGASYGAVLPAWNALLAAYVPPGQKGLGWGVFSTVESIGSLLGPSIGGVLAASLGEPAAVGSAGAIFLVIGVFYVLFPFRLFRGEWSAGDAAR
ncbi:MFS transporter [Cohnella fermenti]|uniref:MFS transporter n=2 Tax=Cohnella fermenti TaxID=2565925 RepID=A0A4S4BT67_9BACL|nr:MFS transporter [Cohnella fermenti]